MYRPILFAACYLALGLYLAEAFHRDQVRAYQHDDTDQRPSSRFLSRLVFGSFWLPIALAAMGHIVIRRVRAAR